MLVEENVRGIEVDVQDPRDLARHPDMPVRPWHRFVWVLGQLVLGPVGAYTGGQVCAWVAHEARGATILIGLVIVLGVVNALNSPAMAAGPRPDDVSMMEATAGARQPTWYLWLNPVIGAVGV